MKPTICMTSQEFYMTSQSLFRTSKYCIHVITPSITVTASIVAAPVLIVYLLYHTYYLCDIKPTICMTTYEFYVTSQPIFMTSQDSTHDITSTQFMTSHPLCSCHHTQYNCHFIHCSCTITYSVLIIPHLLYV